MEEYPPGFRFYPTEEELVSFYLHHKLQETSQTHINRVIPVIDIYDQEPWNLPRFSGELCQGDTEQWFFFVPRQEREARGGRPNRTTASGYWKATGSPSYVYSRTNKVIGVKNTMVFYKGKAPLGQKTKWKMNEYRAIEEEVLTSSISSSTSNYAAPRLRHEMRVCRVYIVSGSSRAFDRRPLGTVITQETFDEQEVHKNEVTISAENGPKIEITSSTESSYLGQNHLEVPDVMEFEGTTSNSQMINAKECVFEKLDWH